MKNVCFESMAYCTWKTYKTYFDPYLLFLALQHEAHVFFLDSSRHHGEHGRYSFLGHSPILCVPADGKDPLLLLRDIVKNHSLSPGPVPFPFVGGVVAYLAYDAAFFMEPKLLSGNRQRSQVPAAWFGVYDTIFVFDHQQRSISVVAADFASRASLSSASRAIRKIRAGERVLAAVDSNPVTRAPGRRGAEAYGLKMSMSRSEYIAAVAAAQDYIRAGDIYQVNLSLQIEAQIRLCAPALFGRMRSVSPTWFGAYLDLGDFQILSASPEQFLRMRDSRITTRPMKGTRPRFSCRMRDAAARKNLVASPKEKAELTMIVDLMRNDIGKVCRYGSVCVESLRAIEEYSSVFQATATVSGCIHPDANGIDLLAACFPGGSVTGCPKMRAMQIIEELETIPRSVYTGCLGYISSCGNLDFSMMIRTAIKRGQVIRYNAGSGIVADSDPEEEYRETILKSAGFIEALGDVRQ
jgi:para-aminobenzoate synthetase component I